MASICSSTKAFFSIEFKIKFTGRSKLERSGILDPEQEYVVDENPCLIPPHISYSIWSYVFTHLSTPT